MKDCEVKLAEASRKTGVPLRALYDGGTGVTTLRIGARIDSPGTDEDTLRRQITTTAKALREAYEEVTSV